jgi:PAS domain S-box-containing protein
MPAGMPAVELQDPVLIIAPVGQDAPAMASLLQQHGFEAQICEGPADDYRELLMHAGALLLTEEAFERPETADLLESLNTQPSWSELPLIILTSGGEPRFARLLDLAASASGGVTLLERPLHSATLLRSVEVALRSRRRQYQVRDLLDDERRRQRALQAANALAQRELEERIRAEERLALRVREQSALYRFVDQLHRATSLNEIYNSALDAISTALRCDRASILLFDDAGIIRFVASRGLSDAYSQAVEGHSPWKAGDRDAAPISVEDVDSADFSQSLKDTLKTEGIQALAFVPLVAAGNLIGKFMTYYNRPHRFTQDELALALTLARQIGFGVERQRAEDSRGRLAAIVESSEDAIVSKDLNGIITSWNLGAQRLFGFTAQETLGQPITIIMPPDRLREEPEILARIRHGEAVEHYETIRRHKNGNLIDVSVTISPIIDREGHVVGASNISRDITRRKQAEKDLQESEERYRTLIDQVEDYAIFRIDLQGRPTTWNQGVRRVLGFDESHFINHDVSSIFTPEDVKAGVPERELRQAAETGSAGNDRWLIRADGARFFATGVTTAVRDKAGAHVGYIKVLRDMTPLAEAQAKLRNHARNLQHAVAERTRDLQAANEQLEAFVYSIAHDLRSPLRTVVGYSQVLQDDYAEQLEETPRNLLKRIHYSAEFMDKLLLDLLAFGRAARAQIDLGPVDVQKAWDAALFQCSSQIEQSQAFVEATQPLPMVIAHEATLGQCLANLLSNALKFVAAGVRPRIRFWAEDRSGVVRLCVEDNGLGVPPDQRVRIFRVFERLHGSRFAGTGIGLSIVRKGAERMGGNVGLESLPGNGSRFWLELPKAN